MISHSNHPDHCYLSPVEEQRQILTLSKKNQNNFKLSNIKNPLYNFTSPEDSFNTRSSNDGRDDDALNFDTLFLNSFPHHLSSSRRPEENCRNLQSNEEHVVEAKQGSATNYWVRNTFCHLPDDLKSSQSTSWLLKDETDSTDRSPSLSLTSSTRNYASSSQVHNNVVPPRIIFHESTPNDHLNTEAIHHRQSNRQYGRKNNRLGSNMTHLSDVSQDGHGTNSTITVSQDGHGTNSTMTVSQDGHGTNSTMTEYPAIEAVGPTKTLEAFDTACYDRYSNNTILEFFLSDLQSKEKQDSNGETDQIIGKAQDVLYSYCQDMLRYQEPNSINETTNYHNINTLNEDHPTVTLNEGQTETSQKSLQDCSISRIKYLSQLHSTTQLFFDSPPIIPLPVSVPIYTPEVPLLPTCSMDTLISNHRLIPQHCTLQPHPYLNTYSYDNGPQNPFPNPNSTSCSSCIFHRNFVPTSDDIHGNHILESTFQLESTPMISSASRRRILHDEGDSIELTEVTPRIRFEHLTTSPPKCLNTFNGDSSSIGSPGLCLIYQRENLQRRNLQIQNRELISSIPQYSSQFSHSISEYKNKDNGLPILCDTESQTEQTEQPLKSTGSQKHPVHCRPCAFFWTKGCINAANCQFCHEWHLPKRKKPMKDQKNLMIIARPDGKIEFLRCSILEVLERS